VIITTCLVVLAVLAYLGRSLTMLTSVGGIAVALWLMRRRTVRAQAVGATVGAVVASVAAEVVHVVYHAAQAGPAEHGGFWVSAILVGSINAAAMLPVIWVDHLLLQRKRAGRQEPPGH
jgi:hypothetical protein